ncbi:unnamed protein product, partial [Rotaria magnacalcarata]
QLTFVPAQNNKSYFLGATPGTLNGPSFDHTTLTSSGYYVYVPSASSGREGEKALLVSPWNSNTNGQCLSFW